MITLAVYTAPRERCGYLPDRDSQLTYDVVSECTAEEYAQRMLEGWRHFGHFLFLPTCKTCSACWSLRILVNEFQANRSQKRAWKQANPRIELRINEPIVDEDRILLHDRYHRFQAGNRGWEHEGQKDPNDYFHSFVMNPFPIEEWTYWLDGKLVGVGYVDVLSVGLSLIYFFYDPDLREFSLGTFNVLKAVERARQLKLPHVYLGYFVEGCQSLEYKQNFQPNEVFRNKQWIPFLSRNG